MGVPRLFPYIIRHFPNAHKIIRKFKKENRFCHIRSAYSRSPLDNERFFLTVDNLFLDSNPFLHSACQEIFAYGEGKRMLKTWYDDKPYSFKLELVFKLFFESILEILSYIRPKKVLFIALDGSAPWAKITQQRERRFKSALSRHTTFDSNSITPGTELMSELTRYLNTKIREEMNRIEGGLFPSQTIFSPCTVPGEGEHKLINYVRKNYLKVRDESSCIYGPDADLIMLALSTHIRDFFVVKPDTNDIDVRHILDFKIVSEELPFKLIKVPEREKKWILCDDFILMGFFVGNDFLPKIQMFLYLEDGLDLLLGYYSVVSKEEETKTQYLTFYDSYRKRHMIDIYTLSKLIGYVQRNEEELLLSSLNKNLGEMFTNHTLKRNVKDGVLNFDSYRREYYQKADINTEDEIKKMCNNYIRGLFWVLQYYLDGIQSWSFYYEYHYPPLMKDLYIELIRLGIDDCGSYDFKLDTYSLNAPLCPFEQLLSVLPKSSVNLLPKELRHLVTDSELAKKGYYEEITDRDIDYEGKTEEFMGIVLLPFINRENIREEFKKYSSIKYHRNMLQREVVFIRDLSLDNMMYISKYGNIKDLHVRKQIL